eukprot:531609-Pyramimonas_sp.AAC.3
MALPALLATHQTYHCNRGVQLGCTRIHVLPWTSILQRSLCAAQVRVAHFPGTTPPDPWGLRLDPARVQEPASRSLEFVLVDQPATGGGGERGKKKPGLLYMRGVNVDGRPHSAHPAK